MLVASSENTGLCPMSFSDSSGNMVWERLLYQRKNGRFCDVEIVVHTQSFAAHRTILAAHSPYFDAIFKWCKITKEQVTVNSKHPQVFERFLNYMYSGKVVIDRSSVSELLRFANNFLIVKLKNYCAEYLDRYLDAANCLAIKTLAQRYNLPSLIKSATDYFDSNLNRCLIESFDILAFTYSQLTRLIQDPKYVDCITPDTYLKLIVRWIGEDVTKREPIFRLLLESSFFHFSEVSTDSLEFLLDYSDLLQKSQKCRFLMLHVMEHNGMLMEKYTEQLAALRQKLVELPVLHESSQFEDAVAEESESEEEGEEYIADGQPTSAQVIEYGNEANKNLKLKIQFASGGDVRKRCRLKRPRAEKMKHRNIGNKTAENDTIPWRDTDDIDGVFATCSLENAYTYGPVDILDPDDVDDDEEPPEESGNIDCVFCGFKNPNEEALQKHKARFHNRNHYYCCHVCNFQTNWSKQFYTHCEEHWPTRPYQCEHCPYTTNEIQPYLTHRLVHSQERYFKCGECAWKGRTRSQLFAHERMHSILDERPVHCEECGRGFKTHTALDHHVSTHNDSRPFKCEDCGFSTKTAEWLSLHRRQHTGDNFNCHIAGCDYSSTKKSQLAAHLRTHMAVRAHLCTICNRGFIEKSHLVRHERIHLEVKPFKCERCDYASSRRDKLKEHIIKHHNSDSGVVSKTSRRKYKRQRMLAAANMNIANSNPDALFRPITENDVVSNWQATNDFSAYSPNQTDFAGPSSFNPSPPRAFSSVLPSSRPQAPPLSAGPAHSQAPPLNPPQSLPTTSMIQMSDVPSSSAFATSSGAEPSDSGISGISAGNTHGVLTTPNLVMRDPHNRSALYTLPNAADVPQHLRPISLPTYGQMDLVQAQAQLLQAVGLQGLHQLQPNAAGVVQPNQPPPQPDNSNIWGNWNMQ